eukprot:749345-Hanusia_phi.AAC.1
MSGNHDRVNSSFTAAGSRSMCVIFLRRSDCQNIRPNAASTRISKSLHQSCGSHLSVPVTETITDVSARLVYVGKSETGTEVSMKIISISLPGVASRSAQSIQCHRFQLRQATTLYVNAYNIIELS